MTESTENEAAEQPEWDEATDPDGYKRDSLISKDWVLDSLLTFIVGDDDLHPGSINLTVTVAGLVVSGRVISKAAYLDLLVGTVRDSSEKPDFPDQLQKLLTGISDYFDEEYKRRSEADLPTRARDFLHMKDVRLYTPGQDLNIPLWRARLSEISSWSLGSHNTDPSD